MQRQTTETMTHTNTEYKGYTIQQRTDIKTHTCVIFKGQDIVKCIAGDIMPDGSTNVISKAKQYIDKNNER